MDVCKMLPSKIRFDDGSTASFPHFFVTDSSQNACKGLQALQVYLTGSWGGKQRAVEPAWPRKLIKDKKTALKAKRPSSG